MMKRIIDKTTNIFIRDDFDFNPETEIGLEVEPSQGLYLPKWNTTLQEIKNSEGYIEYREISRWIEGLTPEEIEAIKAQAEPPEPTLEERVNDTETKVVTLQETIDAIFGGV